MRSLVLRFAGPLQSWGTSPFKERVTSELPTRSGIVGLLGGGSLPERGEMPPWLEGIEVAVRVDRAGRRMRDFHTINPPTRAAAVARGRMAVIAGARRADPVEHVVRRADGSPSHGTEVTVRHYLADAAFVVAIEHAQLERVEELAEAMRAPRFMTYLGRKACAPSFPFMLGLRDGDRYEALASVPSFDGATGPVPCYDLLAGDRAVRHGSIECGEGGR